MKYFLYHANCTDGKGSALAAWMKHGDEGCKYIPVQYDEKPPKMKKGAEIYILDFSYPGLTLEKMAKKHESIVILDHHKTAQSTLESVRLPDNINAVFDMERSGAVISWEYFHPNTDVPELLLHIQDRDLWQWEMNGTKDILTGLNLVDDFRNWKTYLTAWHDTLIIRGSAVNQFIQIQIDNVLSSEPQWITVGGDKIPVFNIPGFMISECLAQALKLYPDSPYAEAYFDIPGKRICSLRSRAGSDVDVSEIAQQFGGGGHRNAAGYSLEIEP
jgi:oligoribonuclease NrnB/cAMP/cGMP phosphodiesterase (DHH superfamily)